MSSVEDNHSSSRKRHLQKKKIRPNSDVGHVVVDGENVHFGGSDGDGNGNGNETTEISFLGVNQKNRRHRNKTITTTKSLRFVAAVLVSIFVIVLVGGKNTWKTTKNPDNDDNEYQQPMRQNQHPKHPHNSQSPKYFVLSLPSTTTDLIDNGDEDQRQQHQQAARQYYDDALNEESAEVWLYRCFTEDQRLTIDRTMNPADADVFVVTGLLHLLKHKKKKQAVTPTSTNIVAEQYKSIIVDPSKPHLFLVPSWNPKVSRESGIEDILSTIRQTLERKELLWSVGFERNPSWQGQVPPSNIIPVPYVVRKEDGKSSMKNQNSRDRIENFIFYAGDRRKNAESWSGCYRSQLLEPLQHFSTNSNALEVRILNKNSRLNQTEYNHRMETSEYCLVVCGDTPTSRSLTSAIVSGCIPIRVGSRLRGLCEKPCHVGFGWTISGSQYPHLPYGETIPWDDFPEVNEQAMMTVTTSREGGGGGTGYDIIQKEVFQAYDHIQKKRLRKIMDNVREGFIYGYGDPITSGEFGDASLYIWNSFLWAAGLVRYNSIDVMS